LITARAPVAQPVPSRTGIGLGVAGAVAVAAAVLAPWTGLGGQVGLTPPGRVMLAAMAVGLGLAAAVSPRRAGCWEALAAGLAALGAAAVLSALTDVLAVAVAVVLVGFAQATRPGRAALVAGLRGPAFGAALLGVGWTLARLPGAAGRAGALCLGLGLAAVAGLVPYLAVVDQDEPPGSPYLPWTAFFGPAVALSLPARFLAGLSVDEGTVLGATLVGLGLLNLAWGTIGAWRTGSDAEAWRCSFLADWGLVLVGLGLFRPDALAAAYLALLSLVLVRLPLALAARPVPEGEQARLAGPFGGLAVVLLAGAAPFSGFPVRLLLVQAATAVAWPLALPLVAGMLLWVAHAGRLARTLGPLQGRTAAGFWLVVACSLALGLLPGVLRAAAGL